MKARTIKKVFLACVFNIGVNVIGIPQAISHYYKYELKERNVKQRYSY